MKYRLRRRKQNRKKRVNLNPFLFDKFFNKVNKRKPRRRKRKHLK